MERKQQVSDKKNDILSASEIGQYTYCSISWYLQRCGYEPDSPSLQKGKTLHKNLGEKIDLIQQNTRKMYWYVLLGVLLSIIVGIIFTLEVSL